MALFAATAGAASALDRAGAIAAIVGSAVALLLLLVGVWRWYVQRRWRVLLSDLLAEGNDLAVQLHNVDELDDQYEGITAGLDQWWKRVETTATGLRADLLPVLRSDSGMPEYSYAGSGPPYAWWRNWTDQRLKQLEKVLGQL